MTKALRRAKGESTGDDDDEESDSEDEGIDLFSSFGGLGDDDDEDGEGGEDDLDGNGELLRPLSPCPLSAHRIANVL